jgi:glycosyltransferase involved in cell wall biosynthesis
MTAILIPAFNAAQSLGSLLEKIPQNIGDGCIVVVDDGSTDDTSRIAADAGAVVIRHERNRGKGAALRSGFEYVLASTRSDSVLTMDADLQHDPAEISKFLAAWETGCTDIVLGCRRFGSGMPIHRILSNTISSSLVSARTGARIRDSQTGFRLIAREVLLSVELEADGYEAETEFLIKAAQKGFRISSVPIATIYGTAPSHMTHWKTTKRFLQVLLREYK